MTADQVVGVRSTEMEKEMEELKKKNSDLETQILTIKYVAVFKISQNKTIKSGHFEQRNVFKDIAGAQ